MLVLLIGYWLSSRTSEEREAASPVLEGQALSRSASRTTMLEDFCPVPCPWGALRGRRGVFLALRLNG